MADYTQKIFYGGEIDQTAQGRDDIQKYPQSLDEMLNFFCHKHGPVSNRPGQEYIGPAPSNNNVRLEPFVYNNDDTYCMVIVADQIYFIRNDLAGSIGYVVNSTAISTTSVDSGTDTVTTTANPHDYEVDQMIRMTRSGTNYFVWIDTLPAANQFTLRDQDGTTIDLDGTETFNEFVYVHTDYTDAEVLELDLKQKSDLVTISHRNHHPMELTRSSHTVWSFTEPDFEPTLARPTALSITPNSFNDRDFFVANGKEHIEARVANISNANPAVMTVHLYNLNKGAVVSGSREDDNFYVGRIIAISDAQFTGTNQAQMEALFGDGQNFQILARNNGASHHVVDLDIGFIGGANVDTSSYTSTYTNDTAKFGSELLDYKVTAVDKNEVESFPVTSTNRVASDFLSEDNRATLLWTAPSGYNVERYNIYKYDNEVYGFIGEAAVTDEGPYFNDFNVLPELSLNPPEEPMRNPFSTAMATLTKHATDTALEVLDHGLSVGDRLIAEFDGVTDSGGDSVDGAYWVRTVTDEDNIVIETEDASDVDSSGWLGSIGSGARISDFPACSAFFRQRRVFASQFNERQQVEASATNQLSSFSKASDAFGFAVNDIGASEIRHVLSGPDLLLFTSGSVVLTTSGEGGFSLATVDNIEQMTAGVAENIPPLKMRSSIIFVQDKVSQIYDLAYTFDQNKYLGEDLTLLVPHFIDGVTITAWAYQKVPEPIVWAILSDGTMLGLTYQRDNNIFGFHLHQTTGAGGSYKDNAVVPEGADEAQYFCTERSINSNTRKYIERQWNRKFTDVRDCKFLDCFTSLDTEVTITNIVEESSANSIKVSASGHGLSDDDRCEIDEVIGATELNLNEYVAAGVSGADFYILDPNISNFWNVTSLVDNTTHWTCTNDSGVTLTDEVSAVFFQNTGVAQLDDTWHLCNVTSATTFDIWTFAGAALATVGSYSSGGQMKFSKVINKADVTAYTSAGVVRKKVTSLTGFDHLEGETVTALADGNVVTGLTVSSGTVTLTEAAARVHIGLPYTSRIGSLPLNNPSSDFTGELTTLQRLIMKLYRSRGVKAGPNTANLQEMRERTDEDLGAPTNLLTGVTKVSCDPVEDNEGKWVCQQDYPLPVTLQSMGLEFSRGEAK